MGDRGPLVGDWTPLWGDCGPLGGEWNPLWGDWGLLVGDWGPCRIGNWTPLEDDPTPWMGLLAASAKGLGGSLDMGFASLARRGCDDVFTTLEGGRSWAGNCGGEVMPFGGNFMDPEAGCVASEGVFGKPELDPKGSPTILEPGLCGCLGFFGGSLPTGMGCFKG